MVACDKFMYSGDIKGEDNMEKIIEIKNLTKRYGNLVALDDFSLDVYEGEILGLLGPNGSGKSTTINTILSLLKYDSGKICIFDQEMSPTAYDIKSKIGVVFQDVAVFEELSVIENIDYFCGLYIKDKKIRKSYVQDAIDLVGLNEFKKFKPKQLSGGLLRRLNIACGIAHKPKLIFLDEPTVAVDPQSRNNILEGIKKLNELGATIVYTTHYMEEVEQLCNRIVIMDKGKIIALGTKDELKDMISLGEKITIELKSMNQAFIDRLKNSKRVINIEIENNIVHISYKTKEDNLSKLIDYVRENNVSYVFLELTGKELRD